MLLYPFDKTFWNKNTRKNTKNGGADSLLRQADDGNQASRLCAFMKLISSSTVVKARPVTVSAQP